MLRCLTPQCTRDQCKPHRVGGSRRIDRFVQVAGGVVGQGLDLQGSLARWREKLENEIRVHRARGKNDRATIAFGRIVGWGSLAHESMRTARTKEWVRKTQGEEASLPGGSEGEKEGGKMPNPRREESGHLLPTRTKGSRGHRHAIDEYPGNMRMTKSSKKTNRRKGCDATGASLEHTQRGIECTRSRRQPGEMIGGTLILTLLA